jgi:hypothetical protein
VNAQVGIAHSLLCLRQNRKRSIAFALLANWGFGVLNPAAPPYPLFLGTLKHVLWRLDDDVLSSYIPGKTGTAPRPGLT